eukprot:Pgem_evm1s11313
MISEKNKTQNIKDFYNEINNHTDSLKVSKRTKIKETLTRKISDGTNNSKEPISDYDASQSDEKLSRKNDGFRNSLIVVGNSYNEFKGSSTGIESERDTDEHPASKSQRLRSFLSPGLKRRERAKTLEDRKNKDLELSNPQNTEVVDNNAPKGPQRTRSKTLDLPPKRDPMDINIEVPIKIMEYSNLVLKGETGMTQSKINTIHCSDSAVKETTHNQITNNSDGDNQLQIDKVKINEIQENDNNNNNSNSNSSNSNYNIRSKNSNNSGSSKNENENKNDTGYNDKIDNGNNNSIGYKFDPTYVHGSDNNNSVESDFDYDEKYEEEKTRNFEDDFGVNDTCSINYRSIREGDLTSNQGNHVCLIDEQNIHYSVPGIYAKSQHTANSSKSTTIEKRGSLLNRLRANSSSIVRKRGFKTKIVEKDEKSTTSPPAASFSTSSASEPFSIEQNFHEHMSDFESSPPQFEKTLKTRSRGHSVGHWRRKLRKSFSSENVMLKP